MRCARRLDRGAVFCVFKENKMKVFASTLIAAAMGFSGAALAADPPAGGDTGGGHSGFREACGADLQTYCPNAKSHDERRTCVQQNKDKFSDGCKSFMASHPRPSSSSSTPAGQ